MNETTVKIVTWLRQAAAQAEADGYPIQAVYYERAANEIEAGKAG